MAACGKRVPKFAPVAGVTPYRCCLSDLLPSIHRTALRMTVKSRTHRIIQIGWPEFGQAAYPPQTSSGELEQRVDQLRTRMEERKLTHLVVYGDPRAFRQPGLSHRLRSAF